MSAVTVKYKGQEVTSADVSQIRTLLTAGKYLEDNIKVTYDNPNAPNLVPLSEEVSSANIYNNGLGYKNGYYISSGNESANANDCMTGCIPYLINGVQPSDVIYIKGYTGATNASHTRMSTRKADKSFAGYEQNGFLSTNNIFDVTMLDTGYYKLTPKANVYHNYTIGYIQFSFNQADGSPIIITVNEESPALDIKKLTATVSADKTSVYTMITDPQLLKARNSPNGFVLMRYLGLTSGVAANMFWFTANFTIGYNNSASPPTAYNSLIIRATASGSIQGNFNTNGLVGTNYNGHINVNSSGGLNFSNNATYPLKAGNYEILAGVWE